MCLLLFLAQSIFAENFRNGTDTKREKNTLSPFLSTLLLSNVHPWEVRGDCHLERSGKYIQQGDRGGTLKDEMKATQNDRN